MAEQEKQEQNQPDDNKSGGTGQASTDKGGQATEPARAGADDRGSDDKEQTGEGTGAKAGEYS